MLMTWLPGPPKTQNNDPWTLEFEMKVILGTWEVELVLSRSHASVANNSKLDLVNPASMYAAPYVLPQVAMFLKSETCVYMYIHIQT